MHALCKLLIFSLSPSVLALYTAISTDNLITDPRLFTRSLPSAYEPGISPRSSTPASHDFLVAAWASFEPVSPAVQALVHVYSVAVAEARARIQGHPDFPSANSAAGDGTLSVAFKYGRFELMFRHDGPDANGGRGLEWGIVEMFCKEMMENTRRGAPMAFQGWLRRVRNYEDVTFVSVHFVVDRLR